MRRLHCARGNWKHTGFVQGHTFRYSRGHDYDEPRFFPSLTGVLTRVLPIANRSTGGRGSKFDGEVVCQQHVVDLDQPPHGYNPNG